MLGDLHVILRPRRREKLRPLLRVELVRGKERYKVLIAELTLRPIGLHVVLKLRQAFCVHASRVPLIRVLRHSENTPVHEDSELRLAKPIRNRESGQGLPIVVKRSGRDSLIDFL